MVLETPNQKRKRGWPDASRNEANTKRPARDPEVASTTQPGDENPRPKNRGHLAVAENKESASATSRSHETRNESRNDKAAKRARADAKAASSWNKVDGAAQEDSDSRRRTKERRSSGEQPWLSTGLGEHGQGETAFAIQASSNPSGPTVSKKKRTQNKRLLDDHPGNSMEEETRSEQGAPKSPGAQPSEPESQGKRNRPRKQQSASGESTSSLAENAITKKNRKASRHDSSMKSQRETASRASGLANNASRKQPEEEAKSLVSPERNARRSERDRHSANDNSWWQIGTNGTPGSGQTGMRGAKKLASTGRPTVDQTKNQDAPVVQVAAHATAPRRKEWANSRRVWAPQADKSTPTRKNASDDGTSKTGPAKMRQTYRIFETSNSADEEEDPLQVSRYPRITAMEKHVPRSEHAKWSPLDEASISMVSAILTDAYDPILLQIRDGDVKRGHAQQMLKTFNMRVQAKLHMLPVPPSAIRAPGGRRAGAGGGHEHELNFEKMVDATQSLEDALTPLLHSVALLEGEEQRERAALEKDYARLQRLEANAKAEAASWRKTAKKAHPLVPDADASEVSRPKTDLGLVQDDELSLNNLFKDLDDTGIRDIVSQLANHMESLKGNLEQIDGILPHIVRSGAALQQALYEQLDEQQYDRVLCG